MKFNGIQIQMPQRCVNQDIIFDFIYKFQTSFGMHIRLMLKTSGLLDINALVQAQKI